MFTCGVWGLYTLLFAKVSGMPNPYISIPARGKSRIKSVFDSLLMGFDSGIGESCCCSSVVEHVLGKDGVMGSNPISS